MLENVVLGLRFESTIKLRLECVLLFSSWTGWVLRLVIAFLMSHPFAVAFAQPSEAALTPSLLMQPPSSDHPELNYPSVNKSVDLLFPHGKFIQIMDLHGFWACAPHQFDARNDAAHWEESASYCAERAREEYRRNALRHALETRDGVFGEPVRSSGHEDLSLLWSDVPERLVMQVFQQAVSSRSTLLSQLLSGRLSYELSLTSGLFSSEVSHAEPQMPRYVVKTEYDMVPSEHDRLAVADTGGESSEAYRQLQARLAARGGIADGAPVSSSKKRLLEVFEDPKGPSNPQDEQARQLDEDKDWRRQISRLLKVNQPLLFGFRGTLDRQEAVHPQDVALRLEEAAASVMFAEFRPLRAEGARESLVYGFTVPYEAARFHVRYDASGNMSSYGLSRNAAGQNLLIQIDKVSGRVAMDFHILL